MDFLTIAGYLIAAVAIAAGLYLLLRKNSQNDNNALEDPDNSLSDDDVLDDEHTDDPAHHTVSDNARIPVVPRHQRESLKPEPVIAASPSISSSQLKNKPAEKSEVDDGIDDDEVWFTDDDDTLDHVLENTPAITPSNTLHYPQTTSQPVRQNSDNQNFISQSNAGHNHHTDPEQQLAVQQSQQLAESSRPDMEPDEDAFDQVLAQLEAATTDELIGDDINSDEPANLKKQQTQPVLDSKSAAGPLNKTVETADVEEWEGGSALLDAHIEDQDRRDEETALAQAEQVVALYVIPVPSRPLTGERTIQLLRQYGLRYGEMSLFHRFADSDGTGPLMFSVLRYTSEGPSGFDLESLPGEQVEGLAFFLALPGKHAVAGFDTMISISTRLAQEIGGQVYDDQMNQLSPQLREHYRHYVLDYRSVD